jgi:Glycosyltransferase like family 2
MTETTYTPLKTNSICFAYRNRPKHLELFFDALDIAASQAGGRFDVYGCDATEYGEDAEEFKDVWPYLSIHWEWDDLQNGLFNKSRALNLAVSMSHTDYVTILDVDCVVPDNFLTNLDGLINDPKYAETKFAHRVRLVPQAYSQRMLSFGLDRIDQFKAKIKGFGIVTEDYLDKVIGCGNFTISRDKYIALGGYDERFVGHGLEDVDFNLRAQYHGIETHLIEDIDLLHVFHHKTPDWNDPAADAANRKLFHQNIKDGHPIPKASDSNKITDKEIPQPQTCCFRTQGEGLPAIAVEKETATVK